MQLVICNSLISGNSDGCDFREESDREALACWATNKVVGRVLVGVGGLVACLVYDFEDGVDAGTLVGVQVRADSVDEGLRQVQWVDAARVEERGIEILGLIIEN